MEECREMKRSKKSCVIILVPALMLILAELCIASPISGPQQSPESKATAGKQAAPPSNMKVTFDESEPGVVIVESNGERVRIDTKAKTFASVRADERLPGPGPAIEPHPALAARQSD